MKLQLFISALFCLFSTGLAYSQISAVELPDLSKRFCVVSSANTNPNSNGWIKRYAIQYKTKNQHGDEVLASGLVAFQQNVVYKPVPLLYLHATPSSRQDVPSQGNFESTFVACKTLSSQTVLIAPDYIGLGYGVEQDHPFMIKDITVSASLDFLKAAKKWLEEQNISSSQSIVLAGYSQGGHAALAIHHHLDHLAKSDLNILHTFAMSAPTSLSKNMLNTMLYGEASADSSFLASVVLTNYQKYYQDIYEVSAFKPQYYQAEFLGPEIEKQQLKALLPRRPRDAMSTKLFRDLETNPAHPFRVHLAENDLQPWRASSGVTLTYSNGDKSVPSSNAIEFYYRMRGAGSSVRLVRTARALPHTVNFLRSIKYFASQLY